ncbi:hypothetical protein P692DRAFT_201793267 [Suillus brevipes Sb2]|nr:hypothetical protein P692DRAFT_201793267 [Suillus brevipes Sb2]
MSHVRISYDSLHHDWVSTDVNVEAHGKHLSLFLDFKRSENHDKGEHIVPEYSRGKFSRTW